MKQALTLENLKNATVESFHESMASAAVKTGLALPIASMAASVSFADSSSGSTSVVSAEMLNPLVKIITDNIGAILPVGITIMGAIIGVSMIPRIIYKFL